MKNNPQELNAEGCLVVPPDSLDDLVKFWDENYVSLHAFLNPPQEPNE